MPNMDLIFKKENLKILNELYLRELNLTRKNIDLIARKAKESYIDVLSALENSHGTEECLLAYDNTLTDLSHLSDTLRKFNLKFELNPFFKNFTENDKDVRDPTEAIFESAEESLRNAQNSVETYTYPRPLYDKYTLGCKFDVIITYIKDKNDLLFYINDYGNPIYGNFVKQLQDYFTESPKPLNRVPEEGEVVGLHLEGYMFRIVRENGPITGNDFKVYILDIGEVITLTKNMCKKLYILSATQQKYCAQAVLCKLESVNSSTNLNLQTYLENNLYVDHKLIVKKRTGDMLHVDLLRNEKTNPFKNTNNQGSVSTTQTDEEPFLKPIINPFPQLLGVASENGNESLRSTVTKKFILKDLHEFVKEGVHEETYGRNSGRICNNMNKQRKMFNVNTLREFLASSTRSDDELSTSSSSRDSGNRRATLTEEERRVLYEEPLNTTNPMKAVMGYEPKDDKLICRYVSPGKDFCFKGSRCKFEHVEKLKDGWTRDQAETIVDIPNKIVFPCNGQTITLKVMQIINVELFFAHIISMENRYKVTLNELVAKMNAAENKPTYKKLRNLPARFQLILAQYKDAMWYRAKVVNLIDDETVKVFYVDYGTSDILNLDRIRQWDHRFNYLPFQAISCRLAGVKEIRHRAVEGNEFLRSKVLNARNIKAKVINNVEQLLVRLFIGPNDSDVSEELIKKGYAEPFSCVQPDRGQLLPA